MSEKHTPLFSKILINIKPSINFSVARVTIDDTVWKHGPEYIFNVKMNVTATPLNRDGVQRSNYTVMNLYCRPKASDQLGCHLNNCRRQSMDLTNDNEIDIPQEEIKHLCSRDPFEITFNEHGVEDLTVHERISVDNLNDLKLIVERFNIGADLNGVRDGYFLIIENTTVGQCVVNMGINHFPSKGLLNKIKGHRYELESLAQLNKVPGEAIVIQKTTNLNNCTHYAPFYFGSYGNEVIVESALHSHLVRDFSNVIFLVKSSFLMY